MANCTVGYDSLDSPLRKTYNLCQLPLSKKYRSHFEIMATILDVAKCGSGDRYFLMKRTGINYAQLKKYLGSLTKIGFIEIRMRGQQMLYCATEKGVAFLRQYYVLLAMLTNVYAPGEQSQIIYQAQHTALKKPLNFSEASSQYTR